MGSIIFIPLAGLFPPQASSSHLTLGPGSRCIIVEAMGLQMLLSLAAYSVEEF